VKGVGIDTASMDYGPSMDFQTHRILMGAGITGLENLTGLDALPARGSWIVAMPMKVGAGSGAPARIAALVRR
jgi:kynurenine formamidase